MGKTIEVTYEQKAVPAGIAKWSMPLLLVGVVLSVLSFYLDPQRALFASLIGFMLAMSVGLGAMFLIAIEYMTGAIWSVPIRRITEFTTSALWIAPILGLPIVLNVIFHGYDMYHWTHMSYLDDPSLIPPGFGAEELEALKNDTFLAQKRPYLTESFFAIRTGVIWLFAIVMKLLIVGGSQKQDKTKDASITKRNVRLSAIFLLGFAVGITILAVDFLMSLEPHWFSTIFGVYYFAGTFATAVAMITLFVLNFNENGNLVKGVGSSHYYSLGGWMFAFTAFWMYMAFSQFMLIWYANIPEETFWFMPRMEGTWGALSALLIFIKFIIPFGLLIQRDSKMNPSRLRLAAVWIIGAHVYDIYWLAYPTYSHLVDSHGPIFGWQELGFVMLTIGLIMFAFNMAARGKNHIPVGDPKLERGLNFHI